MTCEVPPAWLAAFPGTWFLPEYRLMVGHPRGILDNTCLETMLHWMEAVEPQLGAFNRYWDLSEIKELRLDCDEVLGARDAAAGPLFRRRREGGFPGTFAGPLRDRAMYEHFMEGEPIHVEVVGLVSTAAARLGVPADLLVRAH